MLTELNNLQRLLGATRGLYLLKKNLINSINKIRKKYEESQEAFNKTDRLKDKNDQRDHLAIKIWCDKILIIIFFFLGGNKIRCEFD